MDLGLGTKECLSYDLREDTRDGDALFGFNGSLTMCRDGDGMATLGGLRGNAYDVQMEECVQESGRVSGGALGGKNSNSNNNNNNNNDGIQPSTGEAQPESIKQGEDQIKKPDGQQELEKFGLDDATAANDAEEDFTQIPHLLETQLLALDEESAVRATIINPSGTWQKRSYLTLLSPATDAALGVEQVEDERKKCFDLLDALSRSGTLPFEHAQLHVVVGAAHCFTRTVVNAVVQDNVNPVEKLEATSLIFSQTIHRQPAEALVQQSQLGRVAAYSPHLFQKEKTKELELK
jgi:hypothetical protein